MKIQLPDHFFYTNKAQNGTAYVKNGILYIDGYVSFEAVMRTITYVIKGYNTCYYCGRELTDANRSLDHMYPRRWGGVSIPENLIPSCKDCNCDKKGMTYAQFMQYRKFKTQERRNEYYDTCEAENTRVIRRAKFVIEREWISVYKVRELLKHIEFNELEKRKSKKLAAYYRNWGQYTHPVIISSNGRVLKGNHILYHAKKINRKHVIAIVLDNVVMLDKDTS